MLFQPELFCYWGVFRYFEVSIVKKWSFENCPLMRGFPLICSSLLQNSIVKYSIQILFCWTVIAGCSVVEYFYFSIISYNIRRNWKFFNVSLFAVGRTRKQKGHKMILLHIELCLVPIVYITSPLYSLVQWIGYTFDAVWSQIYFIPHQKCIQFTGPNCSI